MAIAYAGQAILHAAITAVVVETLLRLWRSKHADERLALRALVLVLPLALPLAFAAAAPFRQHETFGARYAIFAGQHWNDIRVAGIGLWSGAVVGLSAIGFVLCVRDLAGFLIDRVRRDPRAAASTAGCSDRVERATRELAGRMGIATPTVALLDLAAPVLLCAGVVRPRIVMSTGALARLDADELRAALAHELVHISRRDPLMGWTLMALRVLQAFNPIAQIGGRLAVLELERRADAAVAASGRQEALARSLIKLSDAEATGSGPSGERLGFTRRLAARAVSAELEVRCDRLFDEAVRTKSGMAPARLAIATAGLAGLLFFVV